MRLLQRLPGGEIQLAGPFADDNVPAYAILSHRWENDADQEVNYQDMISGLGREKKGFQKLEFCANQASEDQLEYFWIDTCCIDKSLHGEHQEAMNAMFRWYRRATKCYAYLADVSAFEQNTACRSEAVEQDTASQSEAGKQNTVRQSERTWQSSLQASQWFLRGWTLQELLAPRTVEFFSRDCVQLGDKTTLQDVINAITGISVEALQGRRLTSFSKQERFAWMERRTTKHPEDKVYALQGIFEVELVIQYGEGWASARAKLDEAINVQNNIMRDLRTTHPQHDKIRIERYKGGLLAGVCDWILDHAQFRRWRDSAGCQSLWIRGDPGKGKTMLICSIVNELEKSQRAELQRCQICYFFCQATDVRIDNAVAVLRGLLYMLLDQQPLLTQHIEKQHHHAGRALFEDVNNWVVLTNLFSEILQDPRLNNTIFVIDAFDECTTQRADLLRFIASVSVKSPHVKWLYSSRDWPAIEEPLSRAQQMLHLQLELNAGTIANGVRIFSAQRVHQLATEKGYSESLKQEVLQYFQDNAGDTFLWVALVCSSLNKTHKRGVRARLHEFPPGLDALYARMMIQIEESEDDSDYCKAVLATVALALRPLTLPELGYMAKLPEEIFSSMEDIADIVRRSGCFLTMGGDKDKIVSFVHQSAKDYITGQARDTFFPAGTSKEHARLAQMCIRRMSEPGGLHKDICGLRKPGTRRTDFDSAQIAGMMSARVVYTSNFWAEHLIASGETLCDGDSVHLFLQQYFLFWFEALSWMGQAASAVLYTTRLQSQVNKGDHGQQISAFLYDAYRFVSMNREVADLAPLQLYVSALIFTPSNSIVRTAFLQHRMDMFDLLPSVSSSWSATLQTLTGHTRVVNSVAFSADGMRLASASDDCTIRLWDAATGAPLQTIEVTGWLLNRLKSIACSADGTRLASVSNNWNAQLWDSTTSTLLQTLQGHRAEVHSVAFSPNSTQLATASHDCTIRLWDAATGTPLKSLKRHTDTVTSVAFSADGIWLASASYDRTIQLWDAVTAAPLQSLKGHLYAIKSVAFSPDSTRLASGSIDTTVRLWDAATGAPLQTLTGHISEVESVAFSPDSTQLATASIDCTIRLWDTATGSPLQTLIGHTSKVCSVAFSADGKQLASASADCTLRLWDPSISAPLQTTEGHTNKIRLLAFSTDGSRLASASDDLTVRLWDMATGVLLQTLEEHMDTITAITFSVDGIRLASASDDHIVRLWDSATGMLLQILKGHTSRITSVVFSSDRMRLASASWDKTIRLWNVARGAGGAPLQQFRGHTDTINSVALSADSMRLASASEDCTVRLWDAVTGAPLQTLVGHTKAVRSVAFSADGIRLASASEDDTVRLWDAATGAPLRTLEGHTGWVSSVAFSADGTRLASTATDHTIRLWDAATGALLRTLASQTLEVKFSADGTLLNDFGYFEVFGDDSQEEQDYVLLEPFAYTLQLREGADWIQHKGKDILWLPHDYRGKRSAVYGNTLVIAQKSGALSFFRLKDDISIEV